LNRHRRRSFFQKAFIWVFLLGLLFVLDGRQRTLAQEGNRINLSAWAGFDGYCKSNTWMPVRITVANSGPDLNARVQVSYQEIVGSISTVGADISLPTTSEKEIFLYLPPQNSYRNLEASLLAGNESLATVDLKSTCLSDNNLLVGLIAQDPSAYDILNDIETLSGRMSLAQLQPDSMPDQPQGWDGLDLLVIAGQDMGTFSTAQHQALRSWLANGGKLLIAGGLNWQSTTAGLEDILPVIPTTTLDVNSLAALQPYSNVPISTDTPAILAVGKLRADAEVLVDERGYPLIAQRLLGLGRIYYLAADPSLQPLADWDGMKDLYRVLFGFKEPKPVWLNGRWDTYAANQALSTLSELGIPSIFYICGWLAVYIVIIGPANYLLLRRLKRSELAWLTIPVVVMVFTCSAYIFGFFYRGTEPVLNRISVVQAWDGSEHARVRGLVGLYSPKRAKYTMEVNDTFTFFPFDNSSLQKDGGWRTLQQGTSTLLPDVQVEIGGMQSVSVEGNIPALTFEHDLVLTVGSRTPTLSGTITNSSGLMLKNAILVTPDALKKLGDLPPSSSQDINLPLVPGKRGPQIYERDGWNLLGLNSYDLNINRDTLRQVALLQAIMDFNNQGSKTLGGIYLMGWIDEPLLPVSLRDSQSEAIDTTFYILMLSPSLNIETGSVNLPPNMFTWEASDEYVSPYYAYSSYFPAGGYTLRFRPAIPIRYHEIKSLTLHMESSADPKDVQAYLWDFEKEEWVKLENLSWGARNIPEPWLYVGLEGEIRLKIEGDQNTWIDIGPSNFTLVVEQ